MKTEQEIREYLKQIEEDDYMKESYYFGLWVLDDKKYLEECEKVIYNNNVRNLT